MKKIRRQGLLLAGVLAWPMLVIAATAAKPQVAPVPVTPTPVAAGAVSKVPTASMGPPGAVIRPGTPLLPANVQTPTITATGVPGLATQITTPALVATGKARLGTQVTTPAIVATGKSPLVTQVTTPAIVATGNASKSPIVPTSPSVLPIDSGPK